MSTRDGYDVLDVKKGREFFFVLFVLLEMLLTSSNPIFDLGLNV